MRNAALTPRIHLRRLTIVRTALLWVFACGCGRIGFDAGAPDGPGRGGLTLAYPQPAISAVLGATQVSLVPTISDPAARFAIAPPLPAGLALDATTGRIAGTPTQSTEQTYTVTATTAAASAAVALDVIVLPGYVVTSTADLPDADDGADTQCAATGGACTLRAAIQTTNHRTAKQLVLLDAQTYLLGSALDAIANDVVVAGQSAQLTVIRAATVHAAYAALVVDSAHALGLRDLEIADFGGTDGGALRVTAGSLDVDRCAFTNNASPGSGGVLFINGGARADLARSTFTGNSSLGGNGGGWGGVIDGEDTGTAIVVTRSTATGNSTAWGAFSHITSGTTLRLENSTLYGNTSTVAGTLATPGGIYTLVNTTITGNTNTGSDSAGIYLYSAPCHYMITSSIVAFNRDPAGAEHDCNRRDLTTSITSGGSNIISDSGGNCASFFTGPGDRLATDPAIEPGEPADHGGPTATIWLQADSPAIDGVRTTDCPATDQRGVPRPAGPACDIGAVEVR